MGVPGDVSQDITPCPPQWRGRKAPKSSGANLAAAAAAAALRRRPVSGERGRRLARGVGPGGAVGHVHGSGKGRLSGGESHARPPELEQVTVQLQAHEPARQEKRERRGRRGEGEEENEAA